MTEISRVALFGKLNPVCYKGIESATVFCKMRGNPYVELVHWLHQILQLQDSHLHIIIRHINLVHERIHYHRDHTLAGFADIFHHRLICLFYREWANTEPTVSFDRPENDNFSTYIGSLAGFGADALRDRDAMPDLAKSYYTGFLSSRSKSAEGLRALLANYFRLTVSVEQFVGEWLTIQPSDLSRLGENPLTGELGCSVILGSHVWGCQHKFRIRFDSLNLNQYQSLLPDGYRLEQLTAIIRNYIGDELSWDVNLVLKKDQVPSAQLGESTHLGWTSWLGERSSDHDADDLRLNPFWGKL